MPVNYTIRRPERTAAASIGGHRYAFVCAARMWLQLRAQDYIVVEGNEDVDLIAWDGAVAHHTEVQLKRMGKPLGPGNRLIYVTLAHFLNAWIAHQAENRLFTGVLQTTARFSERARGNSAVGGWIRTGSAVSSLRRHVTDLLQAKAQVPPEILAHISDDARFGAFASCIRWKTGCSATDEEALLQADLRTLAPDLDCTLGSKVLVDRITKAASATVPAQRVLTRKDLWMAISKATLEGLAATTTPHASHYVVGSVRLQHLRATCVLVGDPSRFRSAESAWYHTSDADLVAAVGDKVDFTGYVAISSLDRKASSNRDVVLRQMRYASPRIEQARRDSASEMQIVAKEIARRCICFEVAGRSKTALGPFVTKIRWLRLSNDEYHTAKTLLVLQDAS